MCSIQELETCFNEIAKFEKVVDPQIDTFKGSEKGDNYMGELKVINVNGKNKNLHLLLKCAPKSEVLRQQANIPILFANEILFYEKIIPFFDSFQRKRKNSGFFTSTAKCYKTQVANGEEYLVFENLRESGYEMWDRKKPMNKEHIVTVFKEYAKFHALSFAIKNQEPEVFEKITSEITDIFEVFFDDEEKIKGYNSILENIKNKVRSTIPDEKILNRFVFTCDNWKPFFEEVREFNQKHSVISHGDCWCNNMLFKYNDKNKISPSSMKLIDWQLIKLSPPICDLSHFLYTCAPKEVYDNLDDLLQIYHSTLVEQVKSLGMTESEIISFEELKECWKLYGKYGLYMAFLTLKVMLSDSDEAPDLSEVTEGGEDLIKAFDIQTKHEHIYQKRLNDIIYHLYDNNFL